ncbi:type I-E CRISPR-associated protein Cas6/Cse3/CasE [Streptomyces yunnanensis]|uniref:type I-E CRISPR-associated protein Cas6/Cse3/CasE n=1 Tax=Streptomyces yunnanensis TaxID=156453 RepID=UPI003307AD78
MATTPTSGGTSAPPLPAFTWPPHRHRLRRPPHALLTGIGRAKPYGAGLLTLAPTR